MIISEFYRNEMEEFNLDKTHEEVILYSNAQSKLGEILQKFIEQKEIIEGRKKNEELNRLNETLLDDEYVDRKVKQLATNYLDNEGGLNQALMYHNFIILNYNLKYIF